MFLKDNSPFHRPVTFSKIVGTVLQVSFRKTPPSKVTKTLSNINSNVNWATKFQMNQLNVIGHTKWAYPFKIKFLRANYAPYMTKRLRKAVIKRSELWETKESSN